MSESMNTTTTHDGPDPLRDVANAMQAAVDSAKERASGARHAAASTLPAATQFLSRFVYTTCYTVSYGVVFPTTLIALSVPRNNALVRGLVDGSQAARHKVDELLGQTGDSPVTEAGPSPDPAVTPA